MANQDNLRRINTEQAREMAKKSAEKRNEKKTISKILTDWADKPLTDKHKKELKEKGFDEATTNKALLVLPLIQNATKGDTKSIQMVLELMNEDKEKEIRIKKLEAEIKRLELEAEKVRKEINGEIVENKIIVVSDIPKVEEDDNTD